MQKVRQPPGVARPLAPGGGAFGSLGGSGYAKHPTDDLGLSLYRQPPDVEVSVREFEEYTRDRLKVLHAFDRHCAYDTFLEKINAPDLKGKLTKEVAEGRLSLVYPGDGDPAARKEEFTRRDGISHYALRLAFCKTHDSREWFLRQEQRLFVLRFDELRMEAKERFLTSSGVSCKKFVASQGAAAGRPTLQQLQDSTPGALIWRGEGPGQGKPDKDTNFYEMPFYEVPPKLISARKVVVMRGIAYVPSTALQSILAQKFKEGLSAAMDVAFQGLPTALSDPRIGGFIRDLQEYGMQLLVAKKSSSSEDVGEKLSTENFEEMMVRSFPPCMRRLVERQREMKKHLKHAGRLQLRPFLKECGFTIDESFRWWKQELCKDPEIDAASYEKNYTYDLEHTYGKKGHLQGANSFGCPKIIGFPAESAGQVHGCPFKTLDIPVLKQQLHRWRVPESTMGAIEELINHGKHYQLACVEYFKCGHTGHEGDGVGNSPGDFFRESCRCHVKKQEKEKESGAKGSPGQAKVG